MPDAIATPSTSTEPSSTALDTIAGADIAPGDGDKSFSLEDFAEMPDGGEPAPQPAPTEDDEPAVEPKAEPATAKEDVQEPAVTAPKGARDYTAFDPADVPALKTMSNKAFAWATKMLETRRSEAATLTETQSAMEKLKSGALPDSWHSEPEAYKIAPAYVKHESEFMAAQQSTHKYANALESLALGEAFEVPGSDGKPISIDPAKLDDRGKIKLKTQLESARTHFYEQQREHATAANQFRDSFKAKYTQAEQGVMREMDRLFPIDAKTQPKELAFEKQIIDMFPPEFRNHPATKMAAREGVYINKLMAQIAERDAKIKALEGLKSDKKLAGGVPRRNGAAPATAGDDGDKEFSMKDFES